jgi:predicted  nucleic acid-binding Zn-ribbon protein
MYLCQLTKTHLENELKTLDETRRRIHSLQLEEASTRESETKLTHSLTALRKSEAQRDNPLRSFVTENDVPWLFLGIAEAERELDELRSGGERERRALADLSTHKAMMESELARLNEEIRFSNERNMHESSKRKEIEVNVK